MQCGVFGSAAALMSRDAHVCARAQIISPTYLSLFLTQLQAEGYSIFVVRGMFPAPMADPALPGVWHDVAALQLAGSRRAAPARAAPSRTTRTAGPSRSAAAEVRRVFAPPQSPRAGAHVTPHSPSIVCRARSSRVSSRTASRPRSQVTARASGVEMATAQAPRCRKRRSMKRRPCNLHSPCRCPRHTSRGGIHLCTYC
jgi:hypothetical protein